MQIFNELEDWMTIRLSLPRNLSLGFIPTMGNLHNGHASLFEKSKNENDLTIVSLFVNNTQFNNDDDFKNYPRTTDADLRLLTNIGVDYCLLPTKAAVYPDNYHYQIIETTLSQILEGKQRPGHFTGVLTIVMKLLNIIRPQRAYFGEKDYQQYLLIQEMVKSFFMDVHIKLCPTIREPSGLAYSSRNNRLDKAQLIKAQNFAKIFHQKKSCLDIIKELQTENIRVEYLEEHFGRRFIAVTIDDIRLIDNYCF